ncbi:MarR family winged helix-turn-helix transcriptional regulator [Lacticaseibacillus sp. GG6-2]
MKKNAEIINHQLRLIMIQQQRRMLERMSAKVGVTPQQARVLSEIHQHPGIIQRELADAFQRRSASVSNLLHILERDGYIVRKVPEASGRTKQIFLTPKGQALVAGFTKDYDSIENQMVANLTPDEQEQLIGLLDKVTAAYQPEKLPESVH